MHTVPVYFYTGGTNIGEDSLWRLGGHPLQGNTVHLAIKDINKCCTEIFLFYVQHSLRYSEILTKEAHSSHREGICCLDLAQIF